MIRVEVDGVVVFEEMGEEPAQARPAQSRSGLAAFIEGPLRGTTPGTYTFWRNQREGAVGGALTEDLARRVQEEIRFRGMPLTWDHHALHEAENERYERALYQDPHLPYFTRSARWLAEAERYNADAGTQFRYVRVCVYRFADTQRLYAVRAIPTHHEFEFFHWEEGARCPLFDAEGDEVPVGGLVERQELARMEAERLLRHRQQEVAEYWAMTNPPPIVLRDNGRQVYPIAQVEEGTHALQPTARERFDANAMNRVMRELWAPGLAARLNTAGNPLLRELGAPEEPDPPADDYDTIIGDN